MTTNVAVGRGDATAAATVRRRTVSADSVRSVVANYVNYRSSLPTRRTSNDSRRPDVVVDDHEDLMDGPVSQEDNHVNRNLPPRVEHAVRALSEEFEQRYEEASRQGYR